MHSCVSVENITDTHVPLLVGGFLATIVWRFIFVLQSTGNMLIGPMGFCCSSLSGHWEKNHPAAILPTRYLFLIMHQCWKQRHSDVDKNGLSQSSDCPLEGDAVHNGSVATKLRNICFFVCFLLSYKTFFFDELKIDCRGILSMAESLSGFPLLNLLQCY